MFEFLFCLQVTFISIKSIQLARININLIICPRFFLHAPSKSLFFGLHQRFIQNFCIVRPKGIIIPHNVQTNNIFFNHPQWKPYSSPSVSWSVSLSHETIGEDYILIIKPIETSIFNLSLTSNALSQSCKSAPPEVL